MRRRSSTILADVLNPSMTIHFCTLVGESNSATSEGIGSADFDLRSTLCRITILTVDFTHQKLVVLSKVLLSDVTKGSDVPPVGQPRSFLSPNSTTWRNSPAALTQKGDETTLRSPFKESILAFSSFPLL